MSLTRKLLKELELNDSTIERIIAAHVETVDALRQERDTALSAAADRDELARERDALRTQSEEHLADLHRMEAEFTAYRTQVDESQHRAARRSALADALSRAGANAQAIPLMVDALPLCSSDWNGDALADEGAVIAQAQSRYAPLFAQPQKLPTLRVAPPVDAGGTLSPEDLKRMSATDINRNWTAVRQALSIR